MAATEGSPTLAPAGAAVFVRATDSGIVLGSGRELYQAVVEIVPCPICEQERGARCLTRSGRQATRVHMSRFYAFWEGSSAPVAEELEEA